MSAHTVMQHPMGLHNMKATHTRRVRLVVVYGALMAIAWAVPWMVFFMLQGGYGIVSADILLLLAGVVAIRMTQRGKVRGAAIVLVISLYLRILGMCVFFDIPNDQVPRSIHHFFLPIGIAAYLMLKHEAFWLRHGLAWGCLATVAYFSHSYFGVATEHAVPDHIRSVGNWINNLAAMSVLFGMLYLFVTDIDLLEGQLQKFRLRWIGLVRRLLPRRWKAQVIKASEAITPLFTPMDRQIDDSATHAWQAAQDDRARLIQIVGSAGVIALGVGFAIFFGLRGVWPLVGLHLFTILLGAGLMTTLDTKSRGAHAIVISAGLILVVTINSFVIDVPSPGNPRSTHYAFLPVALGTYYMLRYESRAIMNGLSILCLGIFVVAASTRWTLETAYAVPVADRPPAWAAALAALFVFYGLIHVLVGDISFLRSRLLNAAYRLATRIRFSRP